MIRLHHYYLMSWLKASATTRICCIVLQTTSCQGFRFSYFSSRNFVMSWHNYYYSSTVVVPLLGPALPVLGQCQAVPLHPGPGPGLLRKVKVCMLGAWDACHDFSVPARPVPVLGITVGGGIPNTAHQTWVTSRDEGDSENWWKVWLVMQIKTVLCVTPGENSHTSTCVWRDVCDGYRQGKLQ